MRFSTPGRSRFSPAYLLPIALMAAATLSYLTPSPQAQAESGHRICRYVWNQSLGNHDSRLVSFVLDYKKDGACPYIDYLKVRIPGEVGSWMPPQAAWEHQPVPKMTCENFRDLLKLLPSGDDGDPCTFMENDHLYAVTSGLPEDTPQTRRLWDLGDAWDLG